MLFNWNSLNEKIFSHSPEIPAPLNLRWMGVQVNKWVFMKWGILGACWGILGACWGILGACWRILGACWNIFWEDCEKVVFSPRSLYQTCPTLTPTPGRLPSHISEAKTSWEWESLIWAGWGSRNLFNCFQIKPLFCSWDVRSAVQATGRGCPDHQLAKKVEKA